MGLMSAVVEMPKTTSTKPCAHARVFQEFIEERANLELSEGRYPGLHFHRATRPERFRKTMSFGPHLIVVAQGHNVARFGTLELTYDPCQYLVALGDGTFEGEILDARPDAPHLSIGIDIPSDVIVKTLLALADADAAPAHQPAPAFVANADPALKETVVRYVRANENPIERQVLAPLVLEELVFRLLRSDAAAVLRAAIGRDPDAEAIHRSMRYMRDRAAQPLSVGDVARQVGMGPSHFAHRFRAVAGTSPMQYLKQVRLGEARTLLLTNELRIGEVARRVGYESASHFTRDFRRCFGATPAEYVRHLRPRG